MVPWGESLWNLSPEFIPRYFGCKVLRSLRHSAAMPHRPSNFSLKISSECLWKIDSKKIPGFLKYFYASCWPTRSSIYLSCCLPQRRVYKNQLGTVSRQVGRVVFLSPRLYV